MEEADLEYAFAHRIGLWVVWNVTGWDGKGWIALVVTPARSEAGKPRPAYRLGWNGTRFAASSDLKRFERVSSAADLATELMKILPGF